MIVFRHGDARFPFLWETDQQPPARWHGAGEGPAHYFADTPDGAWAEFLRHEEITDPADVATVRRGLWAIELPALPGQQPRLSRSVMTGDQSTYSRCQQAARRLRQRGIAAFVAPSAALKAGTAGGWHVRGGLQNAPRRDGQVMVLFGPRPDLVGWLAADRARPPVALLPAVRHFDPVSHG